jgi:hypothetical protein
VTVAALLITAPPILAQAASSVSVGAGLSVTTPTNEAAGTDVGAGFVIRLRGGNGFGPSIGMSWFTTPVFTDVGGQQVELGRLSVRPLMFGVGYSRGVSRRLEWGASLAAGVAFGHVRRTALLKAAFGRLGIGQVGAKMDDTFAWRVNTGLWIDLGNRFGLNLSVGYLGVQPGVTITTDAGDTRRTIDLDSVITSVGFTYGIF